MTDKLIETVEDVVLPTLDQLGFEESEKDGGAFEDQERTPLADQPKEEETEVAKEEVEPTVEEQETTTYTEREQEAIRHGWTPRDQFKGDPSLWKDANTFLEHGELMSKISASSKTIHHLQRGVQDMTSLIKKQAEKLDAKERAELDMGRRAAIVEGDIHTVEAYDKKLKELEPVQPTTAGREPETQEFVYANSDWFNDSTADSASMKTYAIKAEEMLAKTFPKMPLSQRLAKTKEMVTKKFPSYFGVKPVVANYKAAQPKVESGSSRATTKKKKITLNDMPPEVRRVAKAVWHASNKAFDLDEYAQQLVDMGEVTL